MFFRIWHENGMHNKWQTALSHELPVLPDQYELTHCSLPQAGPLSLCRDVSVLVCVDLGRHEAPMCLSLPSSAIGFFGIERVAVHRQ
jgi:hypothetical protein